VFFDCAFLFRGRRLLLSSFLLGCSAIDLEARLLPSSSLVADSNDNITKEMQELSVTGATLLSDSQSPPKCTHDHDHSSHSHSHTAHVHNHGQPPSKHVVYATQQQLPTIQLKKPANELVAEYNDSQLLTVCNQIVRLGSYELFLEVIQAWESVRPISAVAQTLQSYDPAGHTLTHWAAKRIDDVRFIEYFLDHHEKHHDDITKGDRKDADASATTDDYQQQQNYYESPLHRPTLDDTKMTPVHWVCTIGGKNAIRILQVMLRYITTKQQKQLNHKNSILELRDGTACTPVLIAAQHGHVDMCAYLIQQGADYSAVDISRDTATHWASYKGSNLVLGLLSFYDISPLTQPDAYGQTPMHLAALRGHVGTVRYIIQQLKSNAQNHTHHRPNNDTTHRRRGGVTLSLKDVLQMKDSNGRTPYELAVHKQQHGVAELLQQTMHPHWRQYVTVRTFKSWLGLNNTGTTYDETESPKCPYYFVWLHITLHLLFLFGIYWPIFNTGDGVLWDYMGMWLVQLFLISGIVYVLNQTTRTNPGRLDSSHPAYTEYRKLYELSIGGGVNGSDNPDDDAVPLCHSCHIARPLRSKHCNITGTCVLAFDHHCPFVGATVGLYNVRYYRFVGVVTACVFRFLLTLSLLFSSSSLQQQIVHVVLLVPATVDHLLGQLSDPPLHLLSPYTAGPLVPPHGRGHWRGYPRIAHFLPRWHAHLPHAADGVELDNERAPEFIQVQVSASTSTVQPVGPRFCE
jgi:palmitoyltransferase ZDHHC13/17